MTRFVKSALAISQVLLVGIILAISAARLPAQNHELPSGPSEGQGVQLLSPTEGVDFRPYVQAMLVSIKRKWFEKMPEAALMGDKGKVAIVVTIQKDGTVAGQAPVIDISSKDKELDKAALDAVRASEPFAHLPGGFSGPEMKLRIFFLYNIPPQK